MYGTRYMAQQRSIRDSLKLGVPEENIFSYGNGISTKTLEEMELLKEVTGLSSEIKPPTYKEIKFIMGAPVYDWVDGQTKNLMYRLRENQDFSDPIFNGIQRISTDEKAKIAAREVQKRFEKLNIIDPSIEIVEFRPWGYEVHASGTFDDFRNNLEKLNGMLSRIGVRKEDFF